MLFPSRDLNTNHVCTFEAIYVVVDAFKRAGTDQAKPLMKAIKNSHITDNASIGPAISFDAKGQNVNIKDAAVQNEKGHGVVIIPRSSAEAEPIWPIRPWNKRA